MQNRFLLKLACNTLSIDKISQIFLPFIGPGDIKCTNKTIDTAVPHPHSAGKQTKYYKSTRN